MERAAEGLKRMGRSGRAALFASGLAAGLSAAAPDARALDPETAILDLRAVVSDRLGDETGTLLWDLDGALMDYREGDIGRAIWNLESFISSFSRQLRVKISPADAELFRTLAVPIIEELRNRPAGVPELRALIEFVGAIDSKKARSTVMSLDGMIVMLQANRVERAVELLDDVLEGLADDYIVSSWMTEAQRRSLYDSLLGIRSIVAPAPEATGIPQLREVLWRVRSLGPFPLEDRIAEDIRRVMTLLSGPAAEQGLEALRKLVERVEEEAAGYGLLPQAIAEELAAELRAIYDRVAGGSPSPAPGLIAYSDRTTGHILTYDAATGRTTDLGIRGNANGIDRGVVAVWYTLPSLPRPAWFDTTTGQFCDLGIPNAGGSSAIHLGRMVFTGQFYASSPPPSMVVSYVQVAPCAGGLPPVVEHPARMDGVRVDIHAGLVVSESGPLTDRRLHLWDTYTGVTTPLGIHGRQPSLDGDWIAFTVSESEAGRRDLNGDGDASDVLVGTFHIPTGKVTYIGSAHAFTAEVSGTRIAYIRHEGAEGRDLNGDGDTGDFLLYTADVVNPSPSYSGVEAFLVDLGAGGVLALYVASEPLTGRDLNADGDLLDDVIGLKDLVRGTNRIIGAGRGPVAMEAR